MGERILIVDDVATNRIVLKVKLRSACYEVLQARSGHEALRMARHAAPDLILLDVMMPYLDGLSVCARLKRDPATRDIPIILITSRLDHASKLEGLNSGADDYLTKPVDENQLLARVRSLLRETNGTAELRQQGASALDLALEAIPAPNETENTIALIAPRPETGLFWRAGLAGFQGLNIRIMTRSEALSDLSASQSVPDIFVIATDLSHRNEGLRLLSDLRSRPATRHAGMMMVLPANDAERAAIALDLGAGDIIYDPFDPAEMAVRLKTQLRRKRQADRLRAGLSAGMQMATTDPLTGLFNRRYAMFQLDRLLCDISGNLAVMVIDIDHFKSVNDRFAHAAGDAILTDLSLRMKSFLPDGCVIARMGGEEFLIATPVRDGSAAYHLADTLREVISGQGFLIDTMESPLTITASIGLAVAHPQNNQTAPRLIEAADAALYASKADGRNRTSLAKPA